MKHRATFLAAIAVAACTGSSEPSTPRPRPSTLERVTSANLTGVVGTEISPTPAVRVRDQNGNPLAGVAVVFWVDSGSGTLLDDSLQTDVDGTATAGRWTLGTQAGDQTITAHSAGLVAVSFTVAARAGPVASITVLRGNNQYGVWGAALPNPLSVKVVDAFFNAIAGAPVSFAVIAGDGSIAGDTATTDSAGTAASGAWTLGRTGAQQVRAQSESAEVVFQAVACASLAWGCAEFDDTDTTLAFVRYPQLYRVALNGTHVVQLTNDEGSYNYSPAWSPDGSRIAFVRLGSQGGTDIYIMNAGGELIRRTNAGEYYSPTWSPDGQKLAVTGWESGLGSSVYVINADDDGTRPIRLTAGWSPAWSPDGSRIAFSNFEGIYTINADGTGLAHLISSSAGRWFGDPAWSPDGRSIGLTVTGNCDWDDDCDTAIGVLDAGASDVRQLVGGSRGVSYAWKPAWSPDGRTIAFSQWGCSANSCSQSVSAINVDGTGERVIIDNGSSPSWRR